MGFAKATIRNLNTHRSIQVQFNPEEYALESANSFNADKPERSPQVGFAGARLRRLELDLFVDTSPSRADVSTQVQFILDLLEEDPATNAPPFLLFTWGSFHFPCVLESVGQRYTQFLSDGCPVRAYLKLTLLESARTVTAPSAAGSPVAQAVHSVRAESDQIAAQATGDPMNWRAIAVANNIDNPRKLTSRMTLKLPSTNPGWI